MAYTKICLNQRLSFVCKLPLFAQYTGLQRLSNPKKLKTQQINKTLLKGFCSSLSYTGDTLLDQKSPALLVLVVNGGDININIDNINSNTSTFSFAHICSLLFTFEFRINRISSDTNPIKSVTSQQTMVKTLSELIAIPYIIYRVKNPAYGRQRISRPMRIVGPIQFWRGCMIYL